jgi:hypothetical protein
MSKRERVIFVILAVIGVTVWTAIAGASGQREAWDSCLFFAVGLPVMLVAAAVAGYLEPKRPWIWGIAVVSLQPLALMVGAEPGVFMLVGLLTFGFFAGGGAAGAYVGSALRMQRNKKNQ